MTVFIDRAYFNRWGRQLVTTGIVLPLLREGHDVVLLETLSTPAINCPHRVVSLDGVSELKPLVSIVC